MADKEGFLKHTRVTPQRRPVPVRLQDWREVYEALPQATLRRRRPAGAWTAASPFCHGGCPLGNLIPEWNDLVYRGHWREAIDRLHATNNFPEFTGRLCPAPCEAACVLGISQDPVTIKQVEVEIIDRAFDEGWVTPMPPALQTGKQVAVVGSGPAGLAAAQQLTRAGHAVTVFERDDRIGGLLRYGIPEFKMEKRHVDRRLEQMARRGDRVPRRRQRRRRHLRRRSCAATSTRSCSPAARPHARDLPIPGRELDGIHQAMEYLPLANRVQQGDLAEPPDHRGGQARRHHRRRRHRRRLPRHGAPPGRRAASTSSRSCRARPRPAPQSTRGRPTR